MWKQLFCVLSQKKTSTLHDFFVDIFHGSVKVFESSWDLSWDWEEHYKTHVRFAVGNRFESLQIFLLMHHYRVINIAPDNNGKCYGFTLRFAFARFIDKNAHVRNVLLDTSRTSNSSFDSSSTAFFNTRSKLTFHLERSAITNRVANKAVKNICKWLEKRLLTKGSISSCRARKWV